MDRDRSVISRDEFGGWDIVDSEETKGRNFKTERGLNMGERGR